MALTVPIIDLNPVKQWDQKKITPAVSSVAHEIHCAMRDAGFFYIKHHGISEDLSEKIHLFARNFFRESPEFKNSIAMHLSGKRWRGYFPVGGELTAGEPDLKEGIYFGLEHDDNHEMTKRQVPLHGKNLWPHGEKYSAIKNDLLLYLSEMTHLGHKLMALVSVGLGLPHDFFKKNYASDPTILFRIFNYPKQNHGQKQPLWGVGPHTDMGLLTILKQDQNEGLEVQIGEDWIAVPPIEGTFVVNIGDILELCTHGIYKATLHRVKNVAETDRLSFPFFFDPGWDLKLKEIDRRLLRASDLSAKSQRKSTRWDGISLTEYCENLSYGDFVWSKVQKVFPSLAKDSTSKANGA